MAVSLEYLHRMPEEVDIPDTAWLELVAYDRLKREAMEQESTKG